MKGDFTRSKFKPGKYRNVRMQQGRVFLDSDWNEQIEIESYLSEIETVDTFGICGGPGENPGFCIITSEEYLKKAEFETQINSLKPGDFIITPGRYYVNGILCENDEYLFYTKQMFGPEPIKESGTYLAYLDVWGRHVSSIEDPEIREVALGGADTTTRVETIWQVKAKKINESDENAGNFDGLVDFPSTGKGRLSTGFVSTGSAEEGACKIAPRRGYLGAENRLYRVEIHDEASEVIEAQKIAPQGEQSSQVEEGSVQDNDGAAKDEKLLTIEIGNEGDWKPSGRPWKLGQVVKIKSDGDEQGILTRVVETIPANRRLKLSPLEKDVDFSAIEQNLHIRRVATFKWSRENGSVAFAVENFVEDFVFVEISGPNKVKIERETDWGLESSLWKNGQTIEIFDDDGNEITASITNVIEKDRILILDEDPTSKVGQNPRIRRVVPVKLLEARRLEVKNEIDWASDGGLCRLQDKVVEIFNDGQKLLARITKVDEIEKTLELDTDVSSLGENLHLRQVSGSNRVKVAGSGRDPLRLLHTGDWVEVLGDVTELRGEPGTLAQIDKKDEMDNSLLLSRNVYMHRGESHLKVRKWDHGTGSDAIPTPIKVGMSEKFFIDLEDGITVSFSGEDFRSGDYWTFRARTSTGKIDPLYNELPHGIKHRYCGLAILDFKDEKLHLVKDCRQIYPPLTEMIELLQELEDKFYKLTNFFYVGGGGQEAMRGDKLNHPLQVGASNGKGPVSGSVVKFEIEEGGGHLGTSKSEIEVLTGSDGVAECFWTLGTSGRQRVKATLRDENGEPVHLPVFFNSDFVIDPNTQLRVDISKFGLIVSLLGLVGSFIGFVWLGSRVFPLFVLFAFAAMFFASMGLRRWE